MKLKDFVQQFPNITIKDISDNSEMLKKDLTDIYTSLETIGSKYNFDDLTPDQITPMLNDIKTLVAILKR